MGYRDQPKRVVDLPGTVVSTASTLADQDNGVSEPSVVLRDFSQDFYGHGFPPSNPEEKSADTTPPVKEEASSPSADGSVASNDTTPPPSPHRSAASGPGDDTDDSPEFLPCDESDRYQEGTEVEVFGLIRDDDLNGSLAKVV